MANENEAAVRSLIENWTAAVRARDLDRILAHHSPDFLMFDVPPPFVSRGLDEYRRTWDTFFAWARDLGVFNIDELQVTAGTDVAFAAALMRCAGIENDGRRTDLRFRLTVGLRRIDGEWTITHEHHSIPAE